jgi:hypothetical protein
VPYTRAWSKVTESGQVLLKSRGAQPRVVGVAPIVVQYRMTRLRARSFYSPTASRADLVYGSYDPAVDPANRVGVLASPARTRFPASGEGDFTASSNGQVIENLDVYGGIRLLSYSNVIVRNCAVYGTLATGTDTAMITFAGDNGRGLLIEDCRLEGRGNPWVSAMRGGGYTMVRTEVTNCTDGLALTSQVGNVTAEGCWFHNGLFMEWDATTPDMPYAGSYYTHVDGVQFHRGKNYVFRGNHIGGTRTNNPADGKAYGHHTGNAANINAGDDLYNSCFMIKQEVDASQANKIENVLIEKNWLEGGTATVNHPSGNGNDFATLTFQDNKFIRNVGGDQIYILLSPSLLAGYTNNTFTDTGLPVPISNGGG